jgi:hypothetical protein
MLKKIKSRKVKPPCAYFVVLNPGFDIFITKQAFYRLNLSPILKECILILYPHATTRFLPFYD